MEVINLGSKSGKTAVLFCNAGLGNLINFTPVVEYMGKEHICDIYVVNNQVEDAPMIFSGFDNVRNIFLCDADDLHNIDVSNYDIVISSRFFDPKVFKHKYSFGGNLVHDIPEAANNFRAVVEAYHVKYGVIIQDPVPHPRVTHYTNIDLKLPDNCIGIHAGWGGHRETWEKKSYKKWKDVAKVLWKMGYKTATFGTEQDREGWESNNKNNVDLIGKLSVMQLGPTMKQLVGFASANSGLSHYASAIGLKSIVLFGPTREVEDAPFGNTAKTLRTTGKCKHAPCKYTQMWEDCEQYRCMYFNKDFVVQSIIDHIHSDTANYKDHKIIFYDLIKDGSNLDKHVINNTIYDREDHQLDGVIDLLDEGSIVYDIGSYIGTYAIPLAIEGMKVYAFEGFPDNYERLKKNCEPYDIDVHLVAVSNETRKITTKFNDCTSNDPQERQIQYYILDNYVKKNKIPDPDFIKLDIEGMETLALFGMNRLITKVKPIWQIGYHRGLEIRYDGYPGFIDVEDGGFDFNEFKKHGYVIYNQNGDVVDKFNQWGEYICIPKDKIG